MKKTSPYLTDEHMNLYEWHGGVATFGLPAETRRNRRWHASYGALAALTSLLILGGCDRQGPAETADEQIGQTIEDTRNGTAYPYEEPAGLPPPAEQAGPALDGAAPPPDAQAPVPSGEGMEGTGAPPHTP